MRSDRLGREALLTGPLKVIAHIDAAMPLVGAEVLAWDNSMTMLEFVFKPALELAAHGFPTETARLVQLVDGRHPDPYAFPIGPTRTWHHRYPLTPEHGCFGQLCLWYPLDPPHLRWSWPEGILALVSIVRRHLWFEEQYRRSGTWPVEDAPHAHARDGRPHPILTPALQGGTE